jgi:FkbM family methyltransferase
MRIPTGQSALGRVLRLPLKLIPSEWPLWVVRGPLRGHRWIPGASVHGCWLGTFERYEQDLLSRIVVPGDVVFDIGANVGFYTLLAARLVAPTGIVVAFEPVARNIRYLRRHLEMNGCSNVRVFAAAVSDQVGTANFEAGPSHSEGHLITDDSPASSAYSVSLVTLDRLVAQRETPIPQLIKIDVEGAEYAVLRGATDLLRSARPQILLSTHSTALRHQCTEYLTRMGYDVRPMRDHDSPESELYCVPMLGGRGAD